MFAFAVESEMIAKNPVRMEGRPGENPEHGAEPFTAGDLSHLRDHAGDDQLIFLLLRWTGLRGSDAVSLTWREVHFDRKEIERIEDGDTPERACAVGSAVGYERDLSGQAR